MEEFAANGCLLDEASYKKLFAFFQKEFELGYEEAVAVTADIWNHLSTGHGDVYGKLQEVIEKYHFQSKEGVRTFSTLLQGVVNSTRMIIHRGHTPNEITVKDKKIIYLISAPHSQRKIRRFIRMMYALAEVVKVQKMLWKKLRNKIKKRSNKRNARLQRKSEAI